MAMHQYAIDRKQCPRTRVEADKFDVRDGILTLYLEGRVIAAYNAGDWTAIREHALQPGDDVYGKATQAVA